MIYTSVDYLVGNWYRMLGQKYHMHEFTLSCQKLFTIDCICIPTNMSDPSVHTVALDSDIRSAIMNKVLPPMFSSPFPYVCFPMKEKQKFNRQKFLREAAESIACPVMGMILWWWEMIHRGKSIIVPDTQPNALPY